MNSSTKQEIMNAFEITSDIAKRDIGLLRNNGFISFTGSSKSGKYILTERGIALFHGNEDQR